MTMTILPVTVPELVAGDVVHHVMDHALARRLVPTQVLVPHHAQIVPHSAEIIAAMAVTLLVGQDADVNVNLHAVGSVKVNVAMDVLMNVSVTESHHHVHHVAEPAEVRVWRIVHMIVILRVKVQDINKNGH